MLEDTDVIDTMGIRDGRYVLMIVDANVTPKLAKRKKLLATKLANYAQTINDGAIPDKKIARKDYYVQIICAVDPGDDYAEFKMLDVRDENGNPLQIPIEIVVHPY